MLIPRVYLPPPGLLISQHRLTISPGMQERSDHNIRTHFRRIARSEARTDWMSPWPITVPQVSGLPASSLWLRPSPLASPPRPARSSTQWKHVGYTFSRKTAGNGRRVGCDVQAGRHSTQNEGKVSYAFFRRPCYNSSSIIVWYWLALLHPQPKQELSNGRKKSHIIEKTSYSTPYTYCCS